DIGRRLFSGFLNVPKLKAKNGADLPECVGCNYRFVTVKTANWAIQDCKNVPESFWHIQIVTKGVERRLEWTPVALKRRQILFRDSRPNSNLFVEMLKAIQCRQR